MGCATANSGTVSVLLGNGNGSLKAARTFFLGTKSWAVAQSDFNGDGRQDLAVTRFDSLAILLGAGDGTFTLSGSFATGEKPVWIAVGDLNADGFEDLMVANLNDPSGTPGMPPPRGQISVLLGLGDGSFAPESRYDAGFNPSSVALADFNQDGRIDVAVSNNGAEISLLPGLGDGRLGTRISVVTGDLSTSQIAAGDFSRPPS